MKVGRKQVILFFIAYFVSFLIYVIIMAYSLKMGYPVFKNSEIWLKDVYAVKDIINNQPTTRQRLLVVGGSSSLFGFNGAMVEANTDFRFINYGTHGGLPLNYHIDRVMKQAKKGDIIFLIPTFDTYTATAPHENYWYIQNMLTWEKDYKAYISTKHELTAYIKNEPLEVLKRIYQYHTRQADKFSPSSIATRKNDTTTQAYKEDGIIIVPCQSQEWAGYNFSSLSPNGDFCTQEGALFTSDSGYLNANLKVSSYFVNEYKKLENFAKNNNIRLLLLYPPSMENPLFSLNDQATFDKIQNLEQELAKHGITIYGDFRDSHFEREYFYDTLYHLNAKGAELRTKHFIQALPHILAKAQHQAPLN